MNGKFWALSILRQLRPEDPTAYVISANIHRRHLSKAQRAMAVAMVYPEPEKGGRGKKSSRTEEFTSAAHISRARTVLRHSRSLAEAVLVGGKSLSDASSDIAVFHLCD